VSFLERKIVAKYLKEEPEKNLLATHAVLIGIIMDDQLPNASLARGFGY